MIIIKHESRFRTSLILAYVGLLLISTRYYVIYGDKVLGSTGSTFETKTSSLSSRSRIPWSTTATERTKTFVTRNKRNSSLQQGHIDIDTNSKKNINNDNTDNNNLIKVSAWSWSNKDYRRPYNIHLSTEENYKIREKTDTASKSTSSLLSFFHHHHHRQKNVEKKTSSLFHGKYAHLRSKLDYKYHSVYTKERQLLQDGIIDKFLHSTIIVDPITNKTCSKPVVSAQISPTTTMPSQHNNNNNQIVDGAKESSVNRRSKSRGGPWIVFTAGAMGAGKSYTVKQLYKENKFPLKSFVKVDPDDIRHLLPEFNLYVQSNPTNAGELTRKEAGYISEILTLVSLNDGRNVLVDGTLRDHIWYDKYFTDLKIQRPNIQIGMIHVTAPHDIVFHRALERSKVTGRIVPTKTIQSALEQVPKSVDILKSKVDFFCELHNNNDDNNNNNNKDDNFGITLTKPKEMTWNKFKDNWIQSCGGPTASEF